MDIVGKPSDIRMAREIYAHLAREIERLAEEGWRRSPDREQYWVSGHSWKRSFRDGAVDTIARRFAAQRQDLAGTDARSTALVRVLDAELDAAFEGFYPKAETRASTFGSHWGYEGYAEGRRAAESGALHKPAELGAGTGRLAEK
jgi:hypothetical protein